MIRGKRKRKKLELRVHIPKRMRKKGVKFRSYRVEVGPYERTYVFVLENKEAAMINQTDMERACEGVREAIAPHKAIFLVTQPGCTFSIMEIIDPKPVIVSDHANGTSAASAKGLQAEVGRRPPQEGRATGQRSAG